MPLHRPPQHAHDALLDPARMAIWMRLRDLAGQGVRQLRQWAPADGLPFASPLPVHQHTMPTLVACLAGQLRIAGRETYDLQPGDVLIVEPGCWHAHLPLRPGTTAFALGFIAERCDLVFNDQGGAPLWGSVPDQPYRQLLTALIGEHRESDRLRLIDELLGGLAGERIDFIDWRRPGLREMAEWLWQHLHEPLVVEEIIARSGLRRTVAFTLFKDFFGRTPKQEVLAQRVDLARHLLQRGYSVAETARLSGFAARAEMTRAFRQRLGHTPSMEGAGEAPRG